jgi:hypothetical protein
MTNKQLGLIALVGAPAMLIGVNAEYLNQNLQDSWFTGLWGIAYITAWMCSLIVMQRQLVTGSRFGKWLIRIMFVTLTIANISNIVQIVTPHNDPWYFFYIDLFWPISHLLMMVLGITILFNKKLDLVSKLIFSGAGFWLPIALISLAVFGRTSSVILYPSIYNAVMWVLMAYLAYRSSESLEYANIK